MEKQGNVMVLKVLPWHIQAVKNSGSFSLRAIYWRVTSLIQKLHPWSKERIIAITIFLRPVSTLSELCHCFFQARRIVSCAVAAWWAVSLNPRHLSLLRWGGIKVSVQCKDCLLFESVNCILRVRLPQLFTLQLVDCSAALSIFAKISTRSSVHCLA